MSVSYPENEETDTHFSGEFTAMCPFFAFASQVSVRIRFHKDYCMSFC